VQPLFQDFYKPGAGLKKTIPVSSLAFRVVSYHIHAIVLNKIREIFPGFFSILKGYFVITWRLRKDSVPEWDLRALCNGLSITIKIVTWWLSFSNGEKDREYFLQTGNEIKKFIA